MKKKLLQKKLEEKGDTIMNESFRIRAEMKEFYTLDDIDFNFRRMLSEKVGGESLLNCIQCGICSSGCTVSEYVDLQPHRMIACCLLGLKDIVLKSNAVWICSLCNKCTERCPKHVEYSFLLAILRNLSVEQGIIPEGYIPILRNINSTGFAIPLSGASVDRRREKMGIPAIPTPNTEQIKKLIQLTGIDNLLETEEKKEDE